MEKLIEYIEQNHHGYHFEDRIVLDFTRCSGRFGICDCPQNSQSYFRPNSKTFWVQQAADRYIFATWGINYYLLDDEATLINIIDEVFHDETILGTPSSLPEHYHEKYSLCQIVPYALLKSHSLEKYHLTIENATEWYWQDDNECCEDWLDVTHRRIREFLDLKCQCSISASDWVDYSCEAVRGHFRLPSIPLDETCRLEITVDADYRQTPECDSFIQNTNAFFEGIFV